MEEMKVSESSRSEDERPAVGAPCQAIHLLGIIGQLPSFRERSRHDPKDSFSAIRVAGGIGDPFPVRRPTRCKTLSTNFAALLQTIKRADPQRLFVGELFGVNHPLPIRRKI